MKKPILAITSCTACLAIASCGNLSVQEIEAYSAPGYCQDASGQTLTKEACNNKMNAEIRAKQAPSQADLMLKNVNDAMATREKQP